jgi:hypothetical protein
MSYGLAPPPLSPVRKLDQPRTGRLRKRDNFLDVRGGQGVEKEPIHTICIQHFKERDEEVENQNNSSLFRRLRPGRRMVVRERAPNYHYLALFVYQLMK